MQLFQGMVFLSFLSGIFILLGWVVQKILGKWYQPVWRYYLWMLLGLRLLIPVDFFTGPGSGASGSGRDEGRRDASGR